MCVYIYIYIYTHTYTCPLAPVAPLHAVDLHADMEGPGAQQPQEGVEHLRLGRDDVLHSLYYYV